MHIESTPGIDASDTISRLEEYLRTFCRFASRAQIGGLRTVRRGTHEFVVGPRATADGAVDLLLMALTHGDEYGGLAVLNAVCADIDRGVLRPRISVGFVIANVAAARRGARFLERDMNRCFGRSETVTIEDRRAREIETTMRAARHCVDLHQTIEPTLTPFFVTAFEPRSLAFASTVDGAIPIVTHWGGAFSASAGQGCTSDEFIQRAGGAAVSIELGRKGFDDDQCRFGAALCARAIAAVTREAAGESWCVVESVSNTVHTFSKVVAYPAGDVVLVPGLRNFQAIAAGEVLGRCGEAVLRCARPGTLLFPKYVAPGNPVKPAELYRLLRRCEPDELVRVAAKLA